PPSGTAAATRVRPQRLRNGRSDSGTAAATRDLSLSELTRGVAPGCIAPFVSATTPRWRSSHVMENPVTAFIDWLNGVVWAPPLVYLCLAAGVYFTIRTRLIQIRRIPAIFRQIFTGEKSADGVSSFQALTMSLAGRVGTGNIAGVATAIAFGGPGAVLWMWISALLGASTSFAESTLGQVYK